MFLLSFIFFILAAICNALMDVLQFHWQTQKLYFRWIDKVNDQFWNPSISWTNKYIDNDPNKPFKYKGIWGWMSNFLDAWHLFKMIMIFCFAFSIIFFPFAFRFCVFSSSLLNGILWLAILGAFWNGSFWLFFNRIFVKKK